MPFLDSEGNEINLKDNGANPDLTANDGAYGGSASLEAKKAGVMEIVAGVKIDGEWKVASKPAIITVNTKLGEEEVKKITEVNNRLIERISDLKETSSVDQIKEDIKKVLKDEYNVDSEKTGVTETAVWYVLDSGVLGAVTIPGGNHSGASMMSLFSATEDNKEANGTEVTVGNRRVAIYTAHDNIAANDVSTMLEESNIAFNIEQFANEEASVENFKKMFTYGTIIFDSTGASLFGDDLTKYNDELDDVFASEEELVIILTGEKATDEKNISYNADLKTGRIAVVDGFYAITPAFIKHYASQSVMPDSLIYANSEYSAANDSLAKEFTKNGALAYLGHKTSEKVGMISTFEKLLNAENLLKDAKSENEKLFGNESVSYTKTSHLKNGSFENSATAGWVSGGHFDIIDRLGSNINKEWHTLFPTDGKYMGIISSGLDESVLNGRQSWVYQTFYVPTDVNVLKFDYNVVSNEPMNFLGSIYDDTFKATIIEGVVKEPQERDYAEDSYDNHNNYYDVPWLESTEDSYDNHYDYYDVPWLESTEDKDEIIIAYESVNSSDWGQAYNDDRQRVDSKFPSGDETTYMTGWKTLTYDVSAFKGKTITLKLQTWDLGDRIYPTALLFDNVRLTKAKGNDLLISGVKEAIIPYAIDLREYQFNALLKDQFGDVVTDSISLRLDYKGYRQPVYTQKGTFSLKEEAKGVTIDSKTGLLTISNDAEPGVITIVASGDGQKVEHEVDLKLPSDYEEVNQNKEYLNGLFEKLNKTEYLLSSDTENTPEAIIAALEELIREEINNPDILIYIYEGYDHWGEGSYGLSIELNDFHYSTDDIIVYATIESNTEHEVEDKTDVDVELEQDVEIE